MGYKISVGGKKFDVEIGPIVDGQVRVSVNNQAYDVVVDNFTEVAAGIPPAAAAGAPAAPEKPARSAVSLLKPAHASFVAGENALTAPIPGLILEVRVRVGDRVSAGQIVAVMEAMKMENNLNAQKDGIVRDIRVQKGTEVSTGDVIMLIH
ncbi:MAG: biotin/lipoyl-binding protein [Desulfobacterales bacterium]|jgi:biotin carboxyl carrier protein|nr:biotin/lipoyl-binding protein [Desulfobacterales bacterium]